MYINKIDCSPKKKWCEKHEEESKKEIMHALYLEKYFIVQSKDQIIIKG